MDIREEIIKILEDGAEVKFGNKGYRVFEDGNLNPPYMMYGVMARKEYLLKNGYSKIIDYFKQVREVHPNAKVIYWRRDNKVGIKDGESENLGEKITKFTTRLCYLPIEIREFNNLSITEGQAPLLIGEV